MIYSKLVSVLAFSAVGVLAVPKGGQGQAAAGGAGGAAAGGAAAANAGGADTSLTLDPSVISTGFANDGTFEQGAEAGEVPSLTSTNNYINFCKGKTLQNGLQITTGSCAVTRKYSHDLMR